MDSPSRTMLSPPMYAVSKRRTRKPPKIFMPTVAELQIGTPPEVNALEIGLGGLGCGISTACTAAPPITLLLVVHQELTIGKELGQIEEREARLGHPERESLAGERAINLI